MKKKYIYTQQEKIQWFGEGEWIDEPDLINFSEKGFDCLIIRIIFREQNGHYFGGYICGYIEIPKQNKFFEFDYNYFLNLIDCHGGITFCEMDDSKKIVGFDCSHTYDLIPSFEKTGISKKIQEDILEMLPHLKDIKMLSKIFHRTYKNIDFCINQCKYIVEQLIENDKSFDASTSGCEMVEKFKVNENS